MNNFIELKPLRNNIGAFIKTNLTEADNDIIKEIKNALDDFGVVFFREQNLTPTSYVQFAKKLGKCADYPRLRGLEGFPEITVVEKKANEKLCLEKVGIQIQLTLKIHHNSQCYIQ